MTDPDGPPDFHWSKSDAPSARGLTAAETLREQIARLEVAIQMMPAETTAAGGPEILAALKRDLARIEGEQA